MSVLDRLTVAVTFDPAKGYVATIPDVAAPVTALSLNGLRRRIEALMRPDNVTVLLSLDRAARRERDRRIGPAAPGRAELPAVRKFNVTSGNAAIALHLNAHFKLKRT